MPTDTTSNVPVKVAEYRARLVDSRKQSYCDAVIAAWQSGAPMPEAPSTLRAELAADVLAKLRRYGLRERATVASVETRAAVVEAERIVAETPARPAPRVTPQVPTVKPYADTVCRSCGIDGCTAEHVTIVSPYKTTADREREERAERRRIAATRKVRTPGASVIRQSVLAARTPEAAAVNATQYAEATARVATIAASAPVGTVTPTRKPKCLPGTEIEFEKRDRGGWWLHNDADALAAGAMGYAVTGTFARSVPVAGITNGKSKNWAPAVVVNTGRSVRRYISQAAANAAEYEIAKIEADYRKAIAKREREPRAPKPQPVSYVPDWAHPCPHCDFVATATGPNDRSAAQNAKAIWSHHYQQAHAAAPDLASAAS